MLIKHEFYYLVIKLHKCKYKGRKSLSFGEEGKRGKNTLFKCAAITELPRYVATGSWVGINILACSVILNMLISKPLLKS